MQDSRRVSGDIHYQIEQFLYDEARMLDQERFREWVDTVIDPAISYQMVVREERYLKDKTPEVNRELKIYDDDLRTLDLRVQQFETGLQRMMDPPQRLQRFISNVSAFHQAEDGKFRVLSYGKVYRSRREYERSEVVYRREDTLRKEGNEKFRIVNRRIDLIERVVTSKNLLFFL